VIAIPAVDLREGACVQLVGGSFADERVRIPNALDAARRWIDAGFSRLHVVDLDAAAGIGSNESAIADVVDFAEARVTVGGGIRSDERIDALFASGVERVVVGTRAIEEPEWLAAIATRHPHRVVVAADVRDRRVTVRAWTKALETTVTAFVDQLDSLPLAAILVTAVHREGRLAGPDLSLVEDVTRASRHAVIASGGITTLDDLRALEQRGATACVIGMALYTGALDPTQVAKEFST
jgi:phosphoribosylformimino-5-aminoimidazole carboxamide ribotide isomerase